MGTEAGPEQEKRVFSVIAFSCSPIKTFIILKVEPGGYSASKARLNNGFNESETSLL
jgi:hypothetical protein